jgi:hypothetical protein
LAGATNAFDLHVDTFPLAESDDVSKESASGAE